MNKIDILLNAINLLYRESNMDGDKSENSIDLVRRILEVTEDSKKFLLHGGQEDTIDNLKSFIRDMCDNGIMESFDKKMIIQSLSLILKEDTTILELFIDNLDDVEDDNELNKRISRIKRFLNNYYKESKIKKLLNASSYSFSNKRGDIKDVSAFIDNLKSDLEALNLNSLDSVDPAIVDEVDLNDDKGLNSIIDKIKNENEFGGLLKTGWQDLNTMTQNGLRRGEFVTVGALQHKYKTGFTLSTFTQLALHNTPKPIYPDKKQLMLWISFEDDVKNIMQFIYGYLHMSEHGTMPDMSVVDSASITSYVKSKLNSNGFHVKILRVNPSEWTYKDIFNKVISYETQGYEVNALGLDYLSMIPTTGCITTGPMGTDLRDLFRRVRNFCSARKILCITPHQLSSDSKRLIRNGVPDASFVKEIAGKGYYSGSTQLDQEIDLELYVHIATNNRKKYLTVQRGKHRLPTTIDEDEMFFMLPFPRKGQIPSDINGEKISIRSFDTSSDEGFGL